MNTKLDKILAEISAGELIDKITILEIKKVKIVNKDKLIEIEKELLSLNETVKKFIPNNSKVSKFKDSLKEINLKLWNIELSDNLFGRNVFPEEKSIPFLPYSRRSPFEHVRTRDHGDDEVEEEEERDIRHG